MSIFGNIMSASTSAPLQTLAANGGKVPAELVS